MGLFDSLFGNRERETTHNLREEARALDGLAGFEVTSIDHDEGTPDPPLRNGRRTDIEAVGPFGTIQGVEFDSGPLTGRERDQMEDLLRYDANHPGYEQEYVGPDEETFREMERRLDTDGPF